MPSPVPPSSWLAITLAVIGCGAASGEYAVRIQTEPASLLFRGRSVDLFVVPACDALWRTAETPLSPLHASVHALPAGSSLPLGVLRSGRYGFYGRVRGDGCAVLAAGCTEYDLRAGVGGTIVITALPVTLASECPTNARCESGTCVCNRACAGRACGPDGCGGSCGSCGARETCTTAGQCVCVPSCPEMFCGADGCGGTCACTGVCRGAVCCPIGTRNCAGTCCDTIIPGCGCEGACVPMGSLCP